MMPIQKVTQDMLQECNSTMMMMLRLKDHFQLVMDQMDQRMSIAGSHKKNYATIMFSQQLVKVKKLIAESYHCAMIVQD
jgi:hypothetical protein